MSAVTDIERESERPYWTLTLDEALASTRSRAGGLSSQEAMAHLAEFGQDRRASKAVARRRARVRTHVEVMRDGRVWRVPAEDVVPGDFERGLRQFSSMVFSASDATVSDALEP